MKLIQLINSQEWLGKLIKVEIDIKKAYTLRKFILEVETELKAYNLIREDLIKKYWEEKDWQLQVKEENIQKFISEISVITEEEVEITIPEISIDDLNGKFDVNTLITLDYLIK